MITEYRQQNDGRQDELSDASGLDCSASKDMARQEFGAEADINNILRRYGIPAPRGQSVFGEVDYDIDLQSAITAQRQAERAHRGLSAEMRERFPTWQAMLNGVVSGDFKAQQDKIKVEAEKSAADRKEREDALNAWRASQRQAKPAEGGGGA